MEDEQDRLAFLESIWDEIMDALEVGDPDKARRIFMDNAEYLETRFRVISTIEPFFEEDRGSYEKCTRDVKCIISRVIYDLGGDSFAGKTVAQVQHLLEDRCQYSPNTRKRLSRVVELIVGGAGASIH